MTIRATVYFDPGVDNALIAELERMPYRRRAGRLVQLLRLGAETCLRQRDGTLHGGLVRCRAARISTTGRVRVGIRLSGAADAAVMQLLAESSNRRAERLRQLAQSGLEREAYWAQVRSAQPAPAAADPLPLAGLPPLALLALRAGSARGRGDPGERSQQAWIPAPSGTPLARVHRLADD
jgi:hypothetical protein